jgi:hypothetical protein
MLLQDKKFLYMDDSDIMDRANDWAKQITTKARATRSREYKFHE